MLIAELAYQQALLARVQAQANRLTDTAALFQALGGGWWNRDEPTNAGTAHRACKPPKRRGRAKSGHACRQSSAQLSASAILVIILSVALIAGGLFAYRS